MGDARKGRGEQKETRIDKSGKNEEKEIIKKERKGVIKSVLRVRFVCFGTGLKIRIRVAPK